MSYNKNRRATTGAAGSSTNDSKRVLLRSELDRLFQILESRHRRSILMSMKEGCVETTTDAMHRSGDDAGTSEMKLIHTHLPKLEDSGCIEWDRTRDEISRGPRFEEIEPILELLETHADELCPDRS